MPVIVLSEAAQALLHRRLAGELVHVTEATRPLYRELVAAGMMMPLHTFALGARAPTGRRTPPATCGMASPTPPSAFH